MEINVTDEDFKEQVLKKSKQVPVLVDFWASWCAPCMILKPILEKIINSDEYKDRFILAKLNVEKNSKTAAEYNIMSIPNVKLFKNSKESAEFIGVKSEQDIKDFLDENL
jgi:thioredoxin